MSNIKIKNKHFIEKYENEIKEIREDYYSNLIYQSKTKQNTPVYLLYLIPIVVSVLTLLLANFSLVGYIISLILAIVINIITSFFYNSKNTCEYTEAIKKLGYSSIEDYEAKLKRIITGSQGYYANVFNEIIEKYNISINTRKICTITGEEYYIWPNQKKDKINLLSTKTNNKPKVITIPISNIRYFRIDKDKNCIIVKTSTEDYYFKHENLDTINELIKEKRLENLKSFNPAAYIDDFEIYMHNIKNKKNQKINSKKDKHKIYLNRTILIFIVLLLLIVIPIIIDNYRSIFNVINILLIIIFNINLRDLTSTKNIKPETEEELIRRINTTPECIERFEELKYALGIKNTYDKVYTNEGAEYLTWNANGYFHVFLNLIYTNVVYMSVKTSDVKYYKVEGKECELKLKDKTLSFTKEASNIFKKMLPNKDYHWLKGYQK